MALKKAQIIKTIIDNIPQLISDGLANTGTIVKSGRYTEGNCIVVNRYNRKQQSSDGYGESLQIWVQQLYTEEGTATTPGEYKLDMLCDKLECIIKSNYANSNSFNIVPLQFDNNSKYVQTINFKLGGI